MNLSDKSVVRVNVDAESFAKGREWCVCPFHPPHPFHPV
jgi:hypothetical protein